MFICEDCLTHEDKKNTFCFPTSHGRCEVCGKTRSCFDVNIHHRRKKYA
jgi:hypothetical protein